MNKKQPVYIAPAIEIIPIASGSVMATSVSGSGLENFEPGTPITSSRSRYGYTTGTVAGSNDLDNMINDILTVGQ